MLRFVMYAALFIAQFVYSQAEYDVVFKNVNIVTMSDQKVLFQHHIAIQSNTIAAIVPAKKWKGSAKKEIDLKGKYIMPSLADAHVHLPSTEEELIRHFHLNLVNGVTKMRSMRGDWKHVDWKQKYNTAQSIYPKLYLTAPPVDRSMEATSEEWDAYVKACKEYEFEMIKILSIRSQNQFKILDSICKKYNIPLGGHFPRLASGNYLSEHVFFNSCYNSIEHLGGLTDAPDFFESRVAAIKKNNIVICPTLSWYSIGSGQYSIEELPLMHGMDYIAPSVMNEWINSTIKYREKLGVEAYKEEVKKELAHLDEKYKVIARLYNEGIPMILSPDASVRYMIPGFNMITEMELLQKAALSPFAILQMATSNFATFFNGNYGELRVGKDADFIVLNDNPLENLKTLKNIQGLYYQDHYLSTADLELLKKQLKEAIKDK